MTLSKTHFTSNLSESVWTKLKSILGSTYVHPTLGSKTITYTGVWPQETEGFRDLLPIIIFTETAPKPKSNQFELGGRRKYQNIFYVNIIAGGFDDESANAYMANDLLDSVLFGFDEQRFNLTNGSGAVEGQYQVNSQEVARFPASQNSVYERHHKQVMITTWVAITV